MSDLCNTKAYLWQSARGHVSWHSVKGDPHVAGAWSERKKLFHGGSFLKLAIGRLADFEKIEFENFTL